MIKTELVWEMDRIVQIVSDNLAADLAVIQPDFKAINFQFGPPAEIKNQLAQLGKSDRRAEKWPAIFLYRPYEEGAGSGEYETVKLTMLIVNWTTANRLSRDRQTENFEPVLLPIYRELIKQIARSKFFVIMDPQADMRHRRLLHDYFGKDTTPDAKKLLHDYVDVLEIRDLELKLSQSINCC